jgi:hypothetical protein
LVGPPFVGGVGVKPMFRGFEITLLLTVTCNCEVRSHTITATNCNDTTMSTLGHQLRQGEGGSSLVYKRAQIEGSLSSIYFVEFCAESWKFILDVFDACM